MESATLKDYVALALVVLKSKPQGIKVEDYILALRQSLSDAKASSSSETCFINAAVLWHNLFKHVNRLNLDLQIEILASVLPGIADGEATLNPAEARISKKRKALTDPIKATSLPKRKKLEPATIFDVELEQVAQIDQHKDRILVLRILFALGRRPLGAPPKADGLTRLICLGSKSILETFRNCDDRSLQKPGTTSESLTLKEACAATKKIWYLIMAKLSWSRDRNDVRIETSVVVAQLCPIVWSLLQRLSRYCLEEAKASNDTDGKRSRSQKRNKRQAMRRKKELGELDKNNCNLVTSTLAHIMAATNTLQDPWPNMFQAITAVFLQRVGSLMSLCLSGNAEDPRCDSLVPRYWPTDVHLPGPETAALARELEAPYLVTILQSLTHHKSICGGSEKPFSEDTLDQLQSSLLHGIFNDTDTTILETGDQNHPQGPSANEPLSHVQVQGQDDKDWFLSQVWELLGWDILLKTIVGD